MSWRILDSWSPNQSHCGLHKDGDVESNVCQMMKGDLDTVWGFVVR